MKNLDLNKMNFPGATTLNRQDLKKILGGNTEVEEIGGGTGAGNYKCVYPTGESVCLYYSSTPYCGKDYLGEQGTLKSC
ncbi:hypothetical protein [Pedobacter ureilyticus]|uniref:Bacteriocin-type signal sequence-containing protein n=1 Tax=Pedobacter ureilyticus TaxID=1393051 RepID=A0ABW9JE62_9SPHI|nr:hypothetical protein [Pedobacter helvus]